MSRSAEMAAGAAQPPGRKRAGIYRLRNRIPKRTAAPGRGTDARAPYPGPGRGANGESAT